MLSVCTSNSPTHETLNHTVLYHTVLYCTILYCTILYCTILYCTILYCTILYCTILYCKRRWRDSYNSQPDTTGTSTSENLIFFIVHRQGNARHRSANKPVNPTTPMLPSRPLSLPFEMTISQQCHCYWLIMHCIQKVILTYDWIHRAVPFLAS